jgi:hypothetical protein
MAETIWPGLEWFISVMFKPLPHSAEEMSLEQGIGRAVDAP